MHLYKQLFHKKKKVTQLVLKQDDQVDILLEIIPETYWEYVVYEEKIKVLCVRMEKTLYGMMILSILYYKNFWSDIESIGYKVNPYDPCVANKQHNITWHADEIEESHVDPKVNDESHKWCESEYGNNEIGYITTVRGKNHDYLTMNIDY